MKFKKIYFTYSNKYINNNEDFDFELKKFQYELEIYNCIMINIRSLFNLFFIKYININKKSPCIKLCHINKLFFFCTNTYFLKIKMNKSLLLNLIPVFSKQPLNNC